MDKITQKSLKTLRVIVFIALALIIILVIVKKLFSEKQEIEFKSFEHKKESTTDEKDQYLADQKEKERFMLLPRP